ncbi:MAG: hypothetical protein HY671_14195 [Chloroflexi bacterium]|nr:hypothetical protein [Chloroflexota bacterium]
MRTIRTVVSTGIAVIGLLAFQRYASAHERWFVGSETHSGQHLPLDSTNLVLLFGAVLFGAMAYTIDRADWTRRMRVPVWSGHRPLPRAIEWRLVASLTGIMLIINAITGVFLASDMVLPGEGLSVVGSAAQLVIGLLLLSQRYFALAGLLVLVAALPLAAIFLPMNLLVDYVVEFAFVAVVLILVGLTVCPDRLARKLVKTVPQRLADLALPITRIGTGLTLVILALHNKLLSPGVALAFLDKYDLNFMPRLGFAGFTDLQFVFAAGVAEVTLGLLLMSGVATRLISATLFAFFMATLALLGLPELIGHLPLMGITMLLVYRGPGRYSLGSRGARRTSGPAKLMPDELGASI